jgi:small subunit ribosomal protein S7
MPRRNRPVKRAIRPDSRFNSEAIGQFVVHVMERGKRSTAERIVYNALTIIEGRLNKSPIEVFEQAMRNITPILEVRPRRVGGATYQVPMEIPAGRRASLAFRWLLSSSHSRAGKSMAEKLAAELMDAYQGVGNTIKKREDTHKMAEANRAFAHYRW